MSEIKWKCPNAGCDREIVMTLDPEAKRDGRRLSGDDIDYAKREIERALERQAQRHLEMCNPRKSVLQGTWANPIPPGQRVKGPDED